MSLAKYLASRSLHYGWIVAGLTLDWIATVPPTVRLTTNVFGKEKAGIMFGWIVAAHQIGAATAALGAGTLRTMQGTYFQAFIISGVLCLIAAVLVLRIGKRPRAKNQELIPQESA